MTQPQRVGAKVKLPVPAVAAARPASTPPLQSVSGGVRSTKYCSHPDHATVEDCKRAIEALTEPVNGPQLCALVAAKNGVLAFRSLMKWDDPTFTSSQPPPEHRTAGEIWTKFEKLMNGCVDHIVEHLNASELDLILGVYVDFADPLRASLALAMRLYNNVGPTIRERPELYRQLRRQLADDPVLKYIFDQGSWCP